MTIKPIVELTINEAVENLKFLLDCSYVDSFEETEKEALKMGIEALKHYGCNSITNTRKLSNKEMIDFLVKQFDISRAAAKYMLHVMISIKRTLK